MSMELVQARGGVSLDNVWVGSVRLAPYQRGSYGCKS